MPQKESPRRLSTHSHSTLRVSVPNRDIGTREQLDWHCPHPDNDVTGRWILTVRSGMDGTFQICKGSWALRCVQDNQARGETTESPTASRPYVRLVCQHTASEGWRCLHNHLKCAFPLGGNYVDTRYVVCQMPSEACRLWSMGARLKKPAADMHNAPPKWWH